MSKFVVIGTSETTLECIKALLSLKKNVVGLFSLRKELLPNNSIDMSVYALEWKIPYYEIEDINSKEVVWIVKSISPDYIISTWPRIISNDIISIPKLMIATHPTPLPFNRGRHPLHWMICLGVPNTVVSFFVMDSGIDTGRILLQIPFNIGFDHIKDVYHRMNKAMHLGLIKLIEILDMNPNFRGYEQSLEENNYWRKRTEDDVILDPRMTISMIKRIVKSFSPPYPMATLYVAKNIMININDALEVKENDLSPNWKNFEHGFIVKHLENSIHLRVDDGVIELFYTNLKPIDFKKNKIIYPPTFYFNK